MLNSNQGAINHLLHGEPLTALNDVYRTVRNRIFGAKDILGQFEDYLNGTPLGRDAKQIATDFWDDWQDGDTPLQAAEKAIAKNGAPLTTDLVSMVANWLGIMDRVDQMNASPTLNPDAGNPAPASDASTEAQAVSADQTS